MAEEFDWNLTTFEGLRRKQREEFAALSFSEKLERLEQMNEIVELFGAARKEFDSARSVVLRVANWWNQLFVIS